MAAIKMVFDGRDRRKEERFSVDLTANLIEPMGNFTQTIDISSHGVGFYCDTRMDRGQACQLVVQVPDPLGPLEPLILPLRVQNTSEQRAMVRIASMIELRLMPELDQIRLSDLINRLKKNASPAERHDDFSGGEIPLPSGNTSLEFWE